MWSLLITFGNALIARTCLALGIIVGIKFSAEGVVPMYFMMLMIALSVMLDPYFMDAIRQTSKERRRARNAQHC